MTTTAKRADRLSVAARAALKPESLVGSYFHSFEATEGGKQVKWQGCVVAEPHPGIFLVELFSWIAGDSTNQQLVRLEEMLDWRFYDDAEWMRNAYEADWAPRQKAR